MHEHRPSALILATRRVTAVGAMLAASACASARQRETAGSAVRFTASITSTDAPLRDEDGTHPSGKKCSATPADSDHNDGFAGSPEAKGDIAAYTELLCFGNLPQEHGADGRSADEQVKGQRNLLMRIMPETRMFKFDPKTLPSGRGVIVAYIRNKKRNNRPNTFKEWKKEFPKDGGAFLYFGKRADSQDLYAMVFVPERRVGQRDTISVLAEGKWGHWDEETPTVRTRAEARWFPKQPHPHVMSSHMSGWVTCLAGCCSADHLFMDS